LSGPSAEDKIKGKDKFAIDVEVKQKGGKCPGE
jgi:hypothetical protein